MSASSDFYWRATIASPHTFRTLINVLESVLSKVFFQLVKTSEFEGLRIEAMHPGRTCLIKARYQCNIEIDTNCMEYTQPFCIQLKTLMPLLRNVNHNNVMRLVCYKNCYPHITLIAFDSPERLDGIHARIFVLNEEFEIINVHSIESKNLVEMELLQLKSLIKTAASIGSDLINFTIQKPVKQPDPALLHNFFTITAKGDSAHTSRTFHSTTPVAEDTSKNDDEDDDMTDNESNSVLCQAAAANFGALKTVYNEYYSTERIYEILKNMDSSVGVLQLYMAPGMPLTIMCALDGSSYIRALFSARIEDCD